MKKTIFFVLAVLLIIPMMTFAEDGNDNSNNEDSGNHSSLTDTTTPPVPYDGACASSAVIAHANAIQTLVDTQQASIKTAATTRRDALGAAYLLTDATARMTAIQAAQTAFKTAKMAADTTFATAAKTENQSFKTAMTACGASISNDQFDNEDSGMNLDQSGNNGLHLGWYVRTLRRGLRGDDVKKIQELLGLNSDGIFGSGTEAKIKEWQAQHGLTPDGVLGHQSFGELEQESN